MRCKQCALAISTAGSTHDESPECTPASSMCSMMPAIRTSSPSESASTSTSVASSRKRSISTGRSCEKLDRLLHVAAHRVFVVGDHHRAPAQHIARPHQHRIADPLRALRHASSTLVAVAVRRRRNLQFVEQLAEQLAIFRQIDDSGIGADDRHARAPSAAAPDSAESARRTARSRRSGFSPRVVHVQTRLRA